MVIRRVSDLRSVNQHNGIAIYGIGKEQMPRPWPASASVTPLTALQMAYGASISVNESYHDISTSLSTSCYYCCHCHAYGSPSSSHLPLVHRHQQEARGPYQAIPVTTTTKHGLRHDLCSLENHRSLTEGQGPLNVQPPQASF